MSHTNNKNLIVNGDDFGMNESVNQGICNTFQKGVLRSASLMVNCAATENAVSLASALPKLELGLHINISEGRCISDPENLPSLVDDTGQFLLGKLHPSQFTDFLTERISSGPSVLLEIRLEIQAQIARFFSFNVKLSHFNFHHYLNFFHVGIMKLYIECAEEHNVPFRGISYPIIDKINIPEQNINLMKIMCHNAKVPFPSSSISNLSEFDPNPISDYPSLMTQKIRELYQNNPPMSIEIIVHPVDGIKDKSYRDSYHSIREQETLLLEDDVFRKYLESRGYIFSGYSSLWGKSRQNGE